MMKLTWLTILLIIVEIAFAQDLPLKNTCKPATEDTHIAAHRISKLIGQKVAITRTYATSFECEADVAGFFVTPQKYLGSTSHALASERVHSGSKAHKAWMHGTNQVIFAKNTNHRGYPTFQFYKTNEGAFQNLVFAEIWVWLDVPLEKKENKSWFSFATFTAYGDDSWQRTLLVNLDSDHIVQLMHVPDQGKNIHDIFQTKTIRFPMRQWVKLSMLLDYTIKNEYRSPYAKVWQNDVLVSAARFNDRLANITDMDKKLWPPCLKTWNRISIEQAEQLCGSRYLGGVAQAHFGMYAPPLLDSGIVYNDDLIFFALKRN